MQIVRQHSAATQAPWARRVSAQLAVANSSERDTALGAGAGAAPFERQGEPLCRRESALRILASERPFPAKRALIRTGTAALSVTERSAWPTRVEQIICMSNTKSPHNGAPRTNGFSPFFAPIETIGVSFVINSEATRVALQNGMIFR